MNNTFSLKSSIALLILGVAIIGTPSHTQSAKSTLVTPNDYQLAIASSAVERDR